MNPEQCRPKLLEEWHAWKDSSGFNSPILVYSKSAIRKLGVSWYDQTITYEWRKILSHIHIEWLLKHKFMFKTKKEALIQEFLLL